VKRQRRLAVFAALYGLAVLAALYGTVAVASWVAAGLNSLGSLGVEGTGAPKVGRATSAGARAEPADAPRATALGERGVSFADIAGDNAALSDPPPMPRSAAVPVAIASLSTSDSERNEAKEPAGSVVADTGSGNAPLLDLPLMPQPATPPVLFAAASPTDPVQNAAGPAVSSEALDACPEPDVCIDQYLWSLYERTPKVDTIKVDEQIKVKVKNKKGKTRTIVETQTKYVTEEFGWKDPKAAQKAGMSLKDYVIGGMDRDFRRKLYNALRAADDAGLSPGITSAFRDDYRQELASGHKAASDSSYHGGSRRGGYGHGLAADVVSVKGETRAGRSTSSEMLWKWIDAHEKELGIGRPYLDKDPPHVGPIDGKEYAGRGGAAKARLAEMKKATPIDGKEYAGKGGAAKARLAEMKKATPIDGKEYAGKGGAKARLAEMKKATPIDGKEYPGKGGAAKAQLAEMKKATPIDGKEYPGKGGAAKAQLAEMTKATPIDGKEYAGKGGGAKARLAEMKKATPIDGKEYAGNGGAVKARLVEMKKPTPIDLKEYAAGYLAGVQKTIKSYTTVLGLVFTSNKGRGLPR
jgi:hypothetical protein